MSHEYFRVNVGALTYRELAKVAPTMVQTLLLWVCKTFRITISQPRAVAYPNALMWYTPEAIPNRLLEAMRPQIDACQTLNVQNERFHRSFFLGNCESYQWTGLIDEQGTALIASVTILEIDHGNKIETNVVSSWSSTFDDGTQLHTTSEKLATLYPAKMRTESVTDSPALEVFQRHRIRLAEIDLRPIPVSTHPLLEHFILKEQQKVFRYLIQRRVFQKLSAEETHRLRKAKFNLRPRAS